MLLSRRGGIATRSAASLDEGCSGTTVDAPLSRLRRSWRSSQYEPGRAGWDRSDPRPWHLSRSFLVFFEQNPALSLSATPPVDLQEVLGEVAIDLTAGYDAQAHRIRQHFVTRIVLPRTRTPENRVLCLMLRKPRIEKKTASAPKGARKT